MPRSRALGFVVLAVLLGASAAVYAQRDFSKVQVESQHLGATVHMLTGAGGNLGVSAGPDGLFLVDDQYAELSDKILTALAKFSDRPLRFVVNTHWHVDHAGGNEKMATAGALLLAHTNVRERMSKPQEIAAFGRKVEASPAAALPVVTFNDAMSFHVNGEVIVHVARAHTDGDAIVFFGPLGDRAALVNFRDVLVGSRDRVRELAAAKKSLAEIQAAKPTAAWDGDWGKGFIKPDKWIEFVYAGVQEP